MSACLCVRSLRLESNKSSNPSINSPGNQLTHTHTHTQTWFVFVCTRWKKKKKKKRKRDKREDESFFIDSFHRVGQRQWQQQRRRWWWHDNSSRKVSTWEPQPLSHHHHHHHSTKTSTAIKDIFSLLSFFWSPETGQSSSHSPPLEQHLCVKKCRCGSFQAARIFMVTTQHTCSVLFCDDVLLSLSILYTTQTYSRDWEDTSLEEPCLFLNRLCWWHLSLSLSLSRVCCKVQECSKAFQGERFFFFFFFLFTLLPALNHCLSLFLISDNTNILNNFRPF